MIPYGPLDVMAKVTIMSSSYRCPLPKAENDMPSRNHYPIKLVGTSTWTGGPEPDVLRSPVKRALLRSENEIVLDCDVSGFKYDVRLTSKNGIHFAGSFSGRSSHSEYPVEAEAKLYSSAEGYLLFGRWIEDNGEYWWWVELKPVASFPDEGKVK